MFHSPFSTALVVITLLTNIFVGSGMLNFAVGAKIHPYTLYPPYILTGIIALCYGFSKISRTPRQARVAFIAFCTTFIVPFVGGLLVCALRFMSAGYNTPAPEHNIIFAVILYVAKTIPYTMAAFGAGCFFAIPLFAFNIFMFSAFRQSLCGPQKGHER